MCGAAVVIFGASSIFAPVACSTSITFPPGYVPGDVTGVPSACTVFGSSIMVSSFDCSFANCVGDTAFAFCDGEKYSGCVCSDCVLTEVCTEDSGGTEDESGFDGFGESSVEASSDAAEAGGDAPVRDFDGSSLGSCSGLVAEKIPARDCQGCGSGVAFALCEGVSFSTCSCTLPPGYTVLPGGPETGTDAPNDGTPEGGDAPDGSPGADVADGPQDGSGGDGKPG